jgi:hypothetical protein
MFSDYECVLYFATMIRQFWHYNIFKRFEFEYLNLLQNKDNTRQLLHFCTGIQEVQKWFLLNCFTGNENFKTENGLRNI